MATDAIASGKDVYLEKPVTHTSKKAPSLTKAVRSSKQILQCGMQQRSWSHFRDAVDLIQGGSLGRVPKSAPIGGKIISRMARAKWSIRKRSTGSNGSAARPINPSAKKNSSAGAGSGISAAAR